MAVSSSELGRSPQDQSMVDAKLAQLSRLAGILDRKSPDASTVAYTKRDGSVTVFEYTPIQKMVLGLQAELVGMRVSQEQIAEALTTGTEQQEVAGIKFNEPKEVPI